jgi:hypothetical protein
LASKRYKLEITNEENTPFANDGSNKGDEKVDELHKF